jgi:hypothetical protein
MAGLVPLPTHRLHSATRLTHREAHGLLSDFLARADVDAAYRPDSTLTERGPQAVSTGGNPNLTLHHLRRVLVGIEGKRVGGLPAADDVDEVDGQKARAKQAQNNDLNLDGTDDWQDKESFVLEQGETSPEITAEDRHPGADLDQPADSAEEERLLKVVDSSPSKPHKRPQPVAGNDDKEERKRQKKLRNKEDKAARAKVRSEKNKA